MQVFPFTWGRCREGIGRADIDWAGIALADIEHRCSGPVGTQVGCSGQGGIAQVGTEQGGRSRIRQVLDRCSSHRTRAFRRACCRTVGILPLRRFSVRFDIVLRFIIELWFTETWWSKNMERIRRCNKKCRALLAIWETIKQQFEGIWRQLDSVHYLSPHSCTAEGRPVQQGEVLGVQEPGSWGRQLLERLGQWQQLKQNTKLQAITSA